MHNEMSLRGRLGVRHIRTPRTFSVRLWRLVNYSRPAFLVGFLKHHAAKAVAKWTGHPVLLGVLRLRLIKADGRVLTLGIAGYRVVTTAFVDYMVDQLQAESSTWGDFKFHDSGVGSTAENITDTDIETTDGESRATGTQTEGASANIYRSVGTISYTTTKAIVEHGLFNVVTAGTLMDRTVFSVVNVVNGDSIQFTYELTCTAGS